MGRRSLEAAGRPLTEGVILADTSAWVEFLRGTGSPVDHRMAELLAEGMATTDPVRMEVLSGARDEIHLAGLRGLLLRPRLVPVSREDYDAAAAIYRVCRRAGATPRSIVDCLVASVAIRSDLPLLHSDRDFGAIARHTGLRLA